LLVPLPPARSQFAPRRGGDGRPVLRPREAALPPLPRPLARIPGLPPLPRLRLRPLRIFASTAEPHPSARPREPTSLATSRPAAHRERGAGGIAATRRGGCPWWQRLAGSGRQQRRQGSRGGREGGHKRGRGGVRRGRRGAAGEREVADVQQDGEGRVVDGLHPVPGQLAGDQGAAVEAAHGAPGATLPRGAAPKVPGAAAVRVPDARAVAAQP